MKTPQGHNDPRHGTRKRYEKGCRCWPCEVAARVREERRRLIRQGVA